MLKVIEQLDDSKAVSGDIPIKIIKLTKIVCASTTTTCFNSCLESCSFSDSLKLADIIPCHKKDSKYDEDN